MARQGWHFLVRITTLTSPKYLSGKRTYLSGSCRGIQLSPAASCDRCPEKASSHITYTPSPVDDEEGEDKDEDDLRMSRLPPRLRQHPQLRLLLRKGPRGRVSRRLIIVAICLEFRWYFITITCGYVSKFSSTECVCGQSVDISGCSWHGIGRVPHEKGVKGGATFSPSGRGVMTTFLEEYLDSVATVPSEIKRNFDLMRELDQVNLLFCLWQGLA